MDLRVNGRLDLGVGSGYQGVSSVCRSRILARSSMNFLTSSPRASRREIFEHDGEFLKSPPSSIAVRCLQMPPLWTSRIGDAGPWRARKP